MAKKIVSFEVEASRIPSLLSALGPFMNVMKEFRISEAHPPKAAVKRAPTRHPYTGERRQGLIETITRVFPSRDSFTVTSDELYRAVAAAGYARSSMTPTLSKLGNEGWTIRPIANGYAITRPGVDKNPT